MDKARGRIPHGRRSAAFAAALLLAAALPLPAAGAAETDRSSAAVTADGQTADAAQAVPGYAAYLAAHGDAAAATDTCTVICGQGFTDDGAAVTAGMFEGRTDALRWESESGTVSWTVDVPRDGLYEIGIDYRALPGKRHAIEVQLLIDGQLPFIEAGELSLPRMFCDETEENGSFARDRAGNELTPRQSEVFAWRMAVLADDEGDYTEPYRVYLTAGSHTLGLSAVREPFLLSQIVLRPPQKIPTYAETRQAAHENGAPAGHLTLIEAERAVCRSDSAVHAVADRSSPTSQPYSAYHTRMNALGGSGWSAPDQWVEWTVDVPADGYYRLAFKYIQSYVSGLAVSRRLTIDGQVPFAEAKAIAFAYTSGWRYAEAQADGEPCLYYLTAGQHTLRLTPTLGEAAESLRLLDEAQSKLNEMYRKIIMITGATPDSYRDHQLDRDIPELLMVFKEQAAVLRREGARLEEVSGRGGSEAAILYRFAEQLESFVRQPNTIASRLERFRENLSGVAAWILQLRGQPLQLDFIALFSPDAALPRAEAGFWATLRHGAESFIGSFLVDYDHVSGAGETERSLSVWVGSARDQAELIGRLVDETFYKETGIGVDLRLVTNALVAATMAGKGPDVALNVGRSTPMDLALRGAVLPLQDMEGFSAVAARFFPTALAPYTLDGRCYGLPETQAFDMMFYRTDIFAELEIDPPDTWDELFEIAPIIQRSNMEIGLPYNGLYSIFTTHLLQNGGALYSDDRRICLLDSREAHASFSWWVDLYRQYGFPLYKNDFSRFRTGEMPMTIVSYPFYNQLTVAAPEIRGLWRMAPVPGTRRADGTIDRSEAATGMSCMIMSAADDPQAAWAFLDWWTRPDVQARFGTELEALLGAGARYAPASREAFEELSWSKDEAAMILAQWQSAVELPEVPGGYYVGRDLDNAFRAAVLHEKQPREMLDYWTAETNKEIRRKLREFGLSS